MALSTYSDLQTAVASWLHRSDLTSMIPDFIRLGELRIFREVRCRQMESTLSGTISSGVLAVPNDYLDIKFAYVNTTPKSLLKRASASQVYEDYPLRSSSGIPKVIAREGSNFIFGPFPDSGYTVSGVYYASPTSIQTSANALFLANPDLYLWAALIETAPYTNDDARIQLWEAKYQQVVAQLDAQDSQEYGSGGGLAVSVG